MADVCSQLSMALALFFPLTFFRSIQSHYLINDVIIRAQLTVKRNTNLGCKLSYPFTKKVSEIINSFAEALALHVPRAR